ncbi:MAG: hypothetical protein ACYC2G_08525 [Gemmatimonadaceae bacterium]
MTAPLAARLATTLAPTLAAVLVTLLTTVATARPATAQAAVRRARLGGPVVEARAELLAARSTTLHLGAAALWPVSPYLRVGMLAAAGVTSGPAASDDRAASARAEVVARFTPNPDPAARWRPYGQATAGVLAVRGTTGRALVSVAVGAEHAPIGAIRPAIEVGIGGGLRVAIALRRAR